MSLGHTNQRSCYLLEGIIHQMAVEMLEEITKTVLEQRMNLSRSIEGIQPLLASYGIRIVQYFIESTDQAQVHDKEGRRAEGLVVERRNEPRTVLTKLGPITYRRTYYRNTRIKEYEYPIDEIVGVSAYQRVETELSKELVSTSRHQSYQRAVEICCEGMLSKQTVLNKIRKAEPVIDRLEERRTVPFLHIDADEDHVALQDTNYKGRVNVPLVSVYEGVEADGKRKYCKHIFHMSAYGKKPEELWEEVLSRIEERYDLSNTKLYLHGDGASWIEEGLAWLPNATFVLDAYHKNKSINGMLADCTLSEKKMLRAAITQALNDEDEEYLGNAVQYLLRRAPQREKKILQAANYLQKHRAAIAIRQIDPEAANGGCTEPHVSHVLSNRLSSRPKGWSKKTLQFFAPILANGPKVTFPKPCAPELSKSAQKAARTVRRESLSKSSSRLQTSLTVLQLGKRSCLFDALYGITHSAQ